MLLFWLGGKTH